MSVLGIDLGNRYATLAVAQRGGIDILINDVSNRKTPSMVGFTGNQRFIGESGLVQFARNVRNTITQVKRLIGRKWDDAELKEELPYLPYRAKEGPNGDVVLEVDYNGEVTTFTPEEILAMFLSKLKEIVERSQGTKVKDVVLSVPVFFTSSQRKSLMDSAHISGLNVLRLINETTASALAWGIYKDFDEKEPTYVMFFDMGDSATTVSVVAYTKGKMRVLSHAWERNLGGRNFDRMLMNHFIEEFKGKYKIDVNTNARAKARLESACEKCKIILSANSQAPLNVESLMEDIDVSGMVTRDQFEKMSGPLLEQFATPIKKALADAGIEASKLQAIELVGGGSRMPQIATVVKEITGKEHSRTLNAEEAVAKGCALQCAILSPLLKVRDFKVEDCTPFPVNLSWKELTPSSMETEDPTEIFTKHSVFPGTKVVTFPRGNPVEISAYYATGSELPTGVSPQIGTYTIPAVPATKSGEPAKIRVKVRLDQNCIFSVESAEVTEVLPVEPEPAGAEPTPAPMDTSASEKKEGAEGTTSPTPAPAEAKKEEPKKEPTTIKHVLTVQSSAAGLTPHQLQLATEAERKRIAQDIEVRETAEKKNALESYVYDTRAALSEDLAPYITDSDKEKFLSLLNATEEWLYGDGESAKRDEYISKLSELKKHGDPVFKRKREDEDRPHAANALRAAMETYTLLADSTDPKYEHITQEERDKIRQKCKEAGDFVFPKVTQLDSLPKTTDPTILSADINHWKENLDRFCPPIMNRPKPAPPKEEPKKEEEKKAEEAPKTPEQPAPAAEEKKDGEAKPSEMDIDN